MVSQSPYSTSQICNGIVLLLVFNFFLLGSPKFYTSKIDYIFVDKFWCTKKEHKSQYLVSADILIYNPAFFISEKLSGQETALHDQWPHTIYQPYLCVLVGFLFEGWLEEVVKIKDVGCKITVSFFCVFSIWIFSNS